MAAVGSSEQRTIYPREGIFKDGLACLDPGPAFAKIKESYVWGRALHRIEAEIFGNVSIEALRDASTGSLRSIDEIIRTFLEIVVVIYCDQEISRRTRTWRSFSKWEAEEILEKRFGEHRDYFSKSWINETDYMRMHLEDILYADYGLTKPQPPPSRVGRCLRGHFDRICQTLADIVNCCQATSPDKRNLIYMLIVTNDIRMAVWMASPNLRVTDIALMLYRYSQRLVPIHEPNVQGGYTYVGILQEFLDELPLRGPSRVEHKLTVDIRNIIPKVVTDTAKQALLLNVTAHLAWRFNIPPTSPPDAYRITTWRQIQNFLAGFKLLFPRMT